MENAADALKMAAAVLIFMVALSISINAFGQARRTAQIVLEMRDREYDYTYVEDKNGGATKRVVSAETIIPSIFKAYKENYKIIFHFHNAGDHDHIYWKNDNNGSHKYEVRSIDLERDVVGGSDQDKETYFNVLVYGPDKVLASEEEKQSFEHTYKIDLQDLQLHPIYAKIEGKQFEESIGVYYQEEVSGGTESPDANKNKKRVITYEELPPIP